MPDDKKPGVYDPKRALELKARMRIPQGGVDAKIPRTPQEFDDAQNFIRAIFGALTDSRPELPGALLPASARDLKIFEAPLSQGTRGDYLDEKRQIRLNPEFENEKYPTLFHEMGHGLGLGHSGPLNAYDIDEAKRRTMSDIILPNEPKVARRKP